MFQLFFSSWKTVFHLNFNNRKFILILEADPDIYITAYEIKWKTFFLTLMKFLSFLWSYYIVKQWIDHANFDPWIDMWPLSPQFVEFSHGYLLNSLNRLPTAFIFFPHAQQWQEFFTQEKTTSWMKRIEQIDTSNRSAMYPLDGQR